jgi:hypothetical protein
MAIRVLALLDAYPSTYGALVPCENYDAETQTFTINAKAMMQAKFDALSDTERRRVVLECWDELRVCPGCASDVDGFCEEGCRMIHEVATYKITDYVESNGSAAGLEFAPTAIARSIEVINACIDDNLTECQWRFKDIFAPYKWAKDGLVNHVISALETKWLPDISLEFSGCNYGSHITITYLTRVPPPDDFLAVFTAKWREAIQTMDDALKLDLDDLLNKYERFDDATLQQITRDLQHEFPGLIIETRDCTCIVKKISSE